MEEKCPLRVFVPNAFTPGSGMNPYFYPVVPNYTHLEFYIYNRWGQLIFKCDDPNEAWDGTYNGKPAQQDVYVWKIEYLDARNNLGKLRGHVNLIR